MRGKSFIEAKLIHKPLQYRYVQNSKHARGEGDVPVENFRVCTTEPGCLSKGVGSGRGTVGVL